MNYGGYYASVTWSDVENITLLGGDYYDVLGYQTGALNSVIVEMVARIPSSRTGRIGRKILHG
ncbi:MAG: hypothetical protein U1E99_05890 [Agitococcus sp.]